MSELADLVAQHGALFKLAWVCDPPALRERGQALGLADPHILEMSAWCAELHMQLTELAEAANLELLLMGGNASALRLDVSEQRGSRDNDYLTTADGPAIAALMRDFTARFAAVFPEPMFRHRQIGPPEGAARLPLLAYAVDVPALLDPNAPDGRLGVKVEFHLSHPASFPESEVIEGEFLAVPQIVTARVPTRPYQIVFKLMTLPAPPVGVEPHREDVLPRQFYDLDLLILQIGTEADWLTAPRYAQARWSEELAQHGLTSSTDELWEQIDKRLEEWSECGERASRYWKLVNQFQSSQLTKGTGQNAMPCLVCVI